MTLHCCAYTCITLQALEVDSCSVQALTRRAAAYEDSGVYSKALTDLATAEAILLHRIHDAAHNSSSAVNSSAGSGGSADHSECGSSCREHALVHSNGASSADSGVIEARAALEQVLAKAEHVRFVQQHIGDSKDLV
jgi:hypothetical protein